jgi:phenylalanyl-tRNA synthetase beta subunit
MQDPIVQMQQQELAIKQGELDLKKQQFAVTAAEKTEKLEIERERIEAQMEIAGLNAGIKVEGEKRKMEAQQELEGLKIGTQISKEQAQMQQNMIQSLLGAAKGEENPEQPQQKERK